MRAEADSKRELAGIALVNSGAVYLGQRQFQMALRMYQRALGHASASADHRSHVSSLIGMGLAFKNVDSETMARQSLEQAIRIAKKHELADLQACALQQLGFFDYASGNFSLAIAQLRSALDLYAQTGNGIDQVRAYFNIALVYADSGDGEAAIRHLERARELRDTHNLQYGDRKIEDAMAEIRRQSGKAAS